MYFLSLCESGDAVGGNLMFFGELEGSSGGVQGSGISCASGEVGGEELSDRECREGREPTEFRI
jgi:hypothetical protein